MRILIVLFFLFSAVARAEDIVDSPEYLGRSKGMPTDVQKWLVRAIRCYQLKAEPSYDKARKRVVGNEIKEIGCKRVQRDGSMLAKKYRKKPPVVRVVKDAKRDFGRTPTTVRN